MTLGSGVVADHALSSVTSSAIVVFLIQKLKAAKWFPLVQKEGTVAWARFLSVVGAAASTVGIQWSWTHSTGTLAISGLTFVAVVQLGWHLVQHLALQEWIYQSALNRAPGTTPPNPPAAS